MRASTLRLLSLLIAVSVNDAGAQGVVTQRQAMELAVPGATWERHTAYFDDDDLVAIAGQAPGVEFDQRVVSYYLASEGGRSTHAAYFDVHPVRTLTEVVMVVISAEGLVDRVEILKFSEPPEYRAPAGWLAQFTGHDLGDDISLKGDIVGMTGATLTARAVAAAVRRQLALHRYLGPLTETAEGEGP